MDRILHGKLVILMNMIKKKKETENFSQLEDVLEQQGDEIGQDNDPLSDSPHRYAPRVSQPNCMRGPCSLF